MTPADRNEAMDSLLPAAERTGDERTDLLEAARRSMRRRIENSRHGGAVIAALHELGMSWREIESQTGIPQGTARRWAEPPSEE